MAPQDCRVRASVVNGARWKVGDRVRLRRGAVRYTELGAGSFVIIELPHPSWVLAARGDRLWPLRKTDLIRMGRGL